MILTPSSKGVFNAWLNRFMVDYDIIRVLKNHVGYKSLDDVSTTEREYCFKNYSSKSSLPMWNTVQENYAWVKIIIIWIFWLIVLVTKADMKKKQLTHQNTQDLNIFCCCFVNQVEWFLSEECLCFILNYLLWWKILSCVVPMIYCCCWRSDSKAVPTQVVVKMTRL